MKGLNMAGKAKKTEQKPVKVEKKCATRKCAKKAVKADKKVTRVIAKINVGWGNSLFIRGAGAELSWDKGIAMQCVGDDEWLWEQLVPEGSVEFKVLFNDSQWMDGENLAVAAGDTVICRPAF